MSAVTWDGTQFVIVGEDRDEAISAATIAVAKARAAVWTSPDGLGWTKIADPDLAAGGLIDTMEDPSSGGAADIVRGAGGLVAVGSTCGSAAAGCSAAVWRSTDGVAWERADVPAISGRLTSVVSSASGYVSSGVQGCGVASGSCPALLLVSTDGRRWERVSFPQNGELGALALVGERLIVSAPFGPVRLWVSPDGRTWEAASVQGGTSPVEPAIDALPWRFASNDGVAVWIGSPGSASGTAAWYSVASAD